MPHHSLYEINTRVWLGELSLQLGKQIDLSNIPESEISSIADQGFNYLWMLGVWQTGNIGRTISRSEDGWLKEYKHKLSDFSIRDVCGSPFAIQAYTVHKDFGGDTALEKCRKLLSKYNMKLILDFVPNHTAIDHPWVWSHSEYYIAGDRLDLVREPHNYIEVDTKLGKSVLAHGRDPYFPGWPDTLQLNYRDPGLRAAMENEIQKISSMCDGIRCDMAMLLMPDIIQRTWGAKSIPRSPVKPLDQPFWPNIISSVKQKNAEFIFMAEVYWDLESALQDQGFDLTYDKRLYDRLKFKDCAGVRAHLTAPLNFQSRSVRFLESHDEDRAAAAFPSELYKAAAVVTYTVPGLRFFHDGQLTGRKNRVAVHLSRRAKEDESSDILDFYTALLKVISSKTLLSGEWRMLECHRAWDHNPTSSHFLSWTWNLRDNTSPVLVVVNFSNAQAQCYIRLPEQLFRNTHLELKDLIGPESYKREKEDLITRGLYLDMPAFGYHVFQIS